MTTYKVIRFYANDFEQEIIETGLSLKEAREYCKDPESSSKTCKLPENIKRTEEYGSWFNGFGEEK